MLTSHAMKKVIIGAALATLLAAPALAQSYSATYGTGNIVNLPLAEHSKGAAGIGPSAYSAAGSFSYARSGSSAYAYVPHAVKESTAAEQALFARAKGIW
jgi:hypothetical protein